MKRLILISLLLFSFSAFSQSTAFIYGTGNLCDNAGTIDVKISLTGTPPWNIVYAIDGMSQSSIATSSNPYIIPTKMAGVYTVVSVSDAIGVGTTSGSAIVTVLQAPTAQFDVLSDTISVFYPTTQFVDQTNGAISWSWNFGDNTPIDTTQNPEHTFPADSNGIGISALYQVSLIVVDVNGCSDTISNIVWVNEEGSGAADEFYIYIPSSFTPDWDAINDKFCLYYHAILESTFVFKVYNLRGDVVFYTDNIKEMVCDNFSKNGWDGRHNKSAKELPIGNYVYEVYFRDIEGWKHHDFGFLHLIR